MLSSRHVWNSLGSVTVPAALLPCTPMPPISTAAKEVGDFVRAKQVLLSSWERWEVLWVREDCEAWPWHQSATLMYWPKAWSGQAWCHRGASSWHWEGSPALAAVPGQLPAHTHTSPSTPWSCAAQPQPWWLRGWPHSSWPDASLTKSSWLS